MTFFRLINWFCIKQPLEGSVVVTAKHHLVEDLLKSSEASNPPAVQGADDPEHDRASHPQLERWRMR